MTPLWKRCGSSSTPGLFGGIVCASNRGDLATHSGGFDNAKPYMTPDPKRNFAGVVLASQKAGKERTMGPRLRLLDLMASAVGVRS